jgi:hypothetical protein
MIWKYAVVPFLVAAGTAAWAGQNPAGTWRGESKCATDAPSCHDEQVVYSIEAIPHRPNQLLIRADKIVDGRAITMGTGPWTYDERRQTLSFESSGRLWLLSIDRNRIDGTLTVDGTILFRRMTLTRDRPESMRFR